MSDIFSDYGITEPGRGKGTRISRLGRRENIAALTTGSSSTPNDEALFQLNRLLEENGAVSYSVRQTYIGLYRTSDELRHMNRPMLAEVMALMYQNGDEDQNVQVEIFADPVRMQPYIDRVLNRTKTADQKNKITDPREQQILYTKMTAEMLCYFRNILLRTSNQYGAAAGATGGVAAPDIDQQLDLAPILDEPPRLPLPPLIAPTATGLPPPLLTSAAHSGTMSVGGALGPLPAPVFTSTLPPVPTPSAFPTSLPLSPSSMALPATSTAMVQAPAPYQPYVGTPPPTLHY